MRVGEVPVGIRRNKDRHVLVLPLSHDEKYAEVYNVVQNEEEYFTRMQACICCSQSIFTCVPYPNELRYAHTHPRRNTYGEG